jgi:hypothetical protein
MSNAIVDHLHNGSPWTSDQYYYNEYEFYKIHGCIESLYYHIDYP